MYAYISVLQLYRFLPSTSSRVTPNNLNFEKAPTFFFLFLNCRRKHPVSYMHIYTTKTNDTQSGVYLHTMVHTSFILRQPTRKYINKTTFPTIPISTIMRHDKIFNRVSQINITNYECLSAALYSMQSTCTMR
jgi:hypothetical protein